MGSARLAVRNLGTARFQVWNIGSAHSDISSVLQEMNLVGHTQLVTGEAFDSTGTLMASVSTDGTVRLWDVSGTDRAQNDQLSGNRRRCLATLDCHAGDAYAVTFLPSCGQSDDDAAGGWVHIDGTSKDLGTWIIRYTYLNGHVEYQKLLRAHGPTTAASTGK